MLDPRDEQVTSSNRPRTMTETENQLLMTFIERNVAVAPLDLDEGIGTVYERIVLDDYFRDIQRRYGLNAVLEHPADGVTGVPGLNSLEFARNGGSVCLSNPSSNMLQVARSVWEQRGLAGSLETRQTEIEDTGFPDESFDLVWNYCMFERFADPSGLIEEMKRVSRGYVMVLTQNEANWGTIVHKIHHRAHDLTWDHGQPSQMRLEAIRTAFRAAGLTLLEEGAIDVPPWLDTWDMPLRGAIKEFLGVFRGRWQWSIDQEQGKVRDGQPAPVLAFVRNLEHWLPEWFRRYQAHHFYVLARR